MGLLASVSTTRPSQTWESFLAQEQQKVGMSILPNSSLWNQLKAQFNRTQGQSMLPSAVQSAPAGGLLAKPYAPQPLPQVQLGLGGMNAQTTTPQQTTAPILQNILATLDYASGAPVQAPQRVIAPLLGQPQPRPQTFSEQVQPLFPEKTFGKAAPALGLLGSIVGDPLNLVGGGASKAPKVFKGFKDLTTKLLEKLKGRTTVSRQFIEDLSNSPDLKQPERDLIRRMLPNETEVSVPDFANKVKSELLPLKTTAPRNISEYRGQSGRYENINLPDELRGPVANYQERVYESPIKTSAGDVHFSASRGGTPESYFAHTRIEDLPGKGQDYFDEHMASPLRPGDSRGKHARYETGTTRRVIELQSDLFQKGRLHEEIMNMIRADRSDFSYNGKQFEVLSYDEGTNIVTGRIGGGKETKIPIPDFEKQNAKKFEEINKLRAFENNWSPRIIREEVKQAAKDGKTKLQFPTGETAMKIEGLGDRSDWTRFGDGTPLKPESLKVGRAVLDRRGGKEWIITDVLGDGKFKAASPMLLENTYEIMKKATDLRLIKELSVESVENAGGWSNLITKSKELRETVSNFTEQFDISGKVDTNNPIYKFYEKEVGRYLTNKYKATRITDAQGVQWYEIDLKGKGFEKAPVEAFGLGAGVQTDEEGNVKFDPMSAALGVLGVAGARSKKVTGLLSSLKDRAGKALGITRASELKAPKTPTAKALATTPETRAQELVTESKNGRNLPTLPSIIEKFPTPVQKKVNILDWIRTPSRVLEKIGLKKESDLILKKYDDYLKELPKNINQITEWSKRAGKASSGRLFKYLDGQEIALSPNEMKVAGEIKTWLSEWADRLKLPHDNRISNYITHIFDDQLIKKEFDEDLAKIIASKVPGSVYDPFLQKRLGAMGYKQDVWAALDAYTKRATRKVHMDEALGVLEEKAGSLENSQWNYIKAYADRINMRPTEFDNYVDNGIKSLIGYRLGQRPTARITQLLRQMTYRAMLGLNVGSALRNLSQGINTYAKLGEKHTVLGYAKLLSPSARQELIDEGIFNTGFIQDRVPSATKRAVQAVDTGLWALFDSVEKINRGAAFLGGKSKALAQGKSLEEAIKAGKDLVSKTQFNYTSVETPVAMASDVVKTLTQFQTFTVKQTEFLTEMAKNKEFLGLLRYTVGGLAYIYTIGQAFGMEPRELLPNFRFGVPPALKLPVEVGKAILDTPDKYGQKRTTQQKLEDIGETAWGVIPGGIQAKKTYEGYKAVQQGASTDKGGREQYKVGGTTLKDAQAIVFGKYATPESKAYYDRKDELVKVRSRVERTGKPELLGETMVYKEGDEVKSKDLKGPEFFEAEVKELEVRRKIKPLFEEWMNLTQQEADTKVNELTDEEYEVYKDVRQAYRAKNTTELRDKLYPNPSEAVSYLRSLPKREQDRILDVLSDDEYLQYEKGK